MSHLIVLTENALTEHDVTRIIEWHDGELQLHILIPERSDQTRFDQTVDNVARLEIDELRADLAGANPDDKGLKARSALKQSLELLSEHDLTATGALTPRDPIAATAAYVTSQDADELWVITDLHLVPDLMRRDWGTKLRQALDIPVLHVIGGTDEVMN